MNLTLAEVAEATGGQLRGGIRSHVVSGYSIDTRTLGAGDLFFAIRGPRFDGHDFVGEARRRGARAAVVAVDSGVSEPDLPCIEVRSPTAALGDLARCVRTRWGRLVIGVTGSVGKTTTKEMIATVLEARYSVLRTRGNLNNQLGLPLSLLAVDEGHEVMVLEMGMSAPGEIRALAAIALPNEGVVTNVNPVHLEFFDSIEGIARAKAELVGGLVAGSGGSRRAYLNADDERVRAMSEGFGGEVVTWGRAPDADFRIAVASDSGLEGSMFTIRHQNVDVEFQTPLPGVHNVSNATAAIAVGVTHGVGWDGAREQVREFAPTGLRGVVRRFEEGFVLVDDSYNSSPAALREMIRFVGALPGFRRRILVAGEMLELGPDGEDLHADCGRVAHQEGMDLVIGVRGAASEILRGAREAGAPSENLVFLQTAEEAGEFLASVVGEGDVVLVKASRGVGLDKVSEILGRQFATLEC